MPRRHSISFLLFFVAMHATAFSQSSLYRLEIFGTRNGLLSSKVHALAQAADRVLWIGTELGASSYNGYTFTNYQYTSGNELIGRILCVTQDSLQGIWLGGDKGLFYFSGDSIKRITLHSRSGIAVEALLTDANGNVWVGDINALYKIDATRIKNIRERSISIPELSPHASFSKRVYGLASDSKKNIYAASFDGVFKFPSNSSTYEIIWTNPDPYNFVRSVTATSPDSIFWNCYDGHPVQMIKGNVQGFYSKDFVGRTVFKHQGKIFALTTSGIAVLNPGAIQPLVLLVSITNHSPAALIDVEGNIWAATWEGLQKFRKTVFSVHTLPPGGPAEVFSMLETKSGDLLFGSNRGKVFIKKENQILPHNIPPLFPLAEVMCMYEDSQNGLWAGSGYQGICRFINNKLTRYKSAGFLKDNNCEELYARTDSKLFASTEKGVTLIDPLEGDPLIDHISFLKKYTRFPELFGCFQSGNSGFWFYGSQGLYMLHNNHLVDDSIHNMPVKSLHINKIIADKKGNIWVATLGKGLLQCRLKNGKLTLQQQYDTKKGLPSDNALSVLVDENDNVWWGDYMSLSLLVDPGVNEQITTFNEKDGLLSSYYQTLKLEQQHNGTIWALTSMGMISFHPDSISRNTLPPILLLNHISTDRGATRFNGISPFNLSYKSNSLEFHYTAVGLTDPSKIRYAYRLKDVDSNWTYTNNRSVGFNLLPPGEYTFELKACNNNNVWTPESLQIHFTISPPFWQTWWFRILVVLLIVFFLVVLFRKRMAVFKARAAIRQQMAELEAKAIRAQMNPHFIFNSLNAIQESIVLNDFDTSYQYLSKFSKLLRLVLNNSEKNFIPLQSEIEMNRLYLELESLRFKHSFTYSIEADEQIDTDMVQFPSLMLQPFIENAVWHGLMQREGEKNLCIRFSQHEQQLNCVIEDNGIGREKAASIKKQKLGSQYFESKGTDLARQRIKLLQESGMMKASLTIEDIKNELGEVAGTRVIIIIPIVEPKQERLQNKNEEKI